LSSKSILTLIPDIYSHIGGPNGITNLPSDLGNSIQSAVAGSLGPQPRRGLRLSRLGPQCPCALWYSVHHPELGEELPPQARIKFVYGHIIEHLIIGLAKAAGHEVTGEQDELILDGISGHRDCIIDGCIVDVKSAASRSFLKFRDKTLAEDDPFGYLDQLDGYAVASLDDPLVRVKDKAYLLAVDKTLGHLALYEHVIRERAIKERIRRYKRIIELDAPPTCECGFDVEDNGNIILDVPASYNSYKLCCDPKVRTILYSSGPKFFKRIVKYPMYKGQPLPELTKTLH
jgi:hypothetical protein